MWLVLLEMVLVVLFFLSFRFGWSSKKIEVVFCDVGQGDAMLIKTFTGQDVLIDGGPGDAVLSCLGNHLPFYDRSLDLVILTHPHQDHLGGLVAVLDKYSVNSIIASGLDIAVGNATGKELGQKIKEKNIKTTSAVAGQVVDFGQGIKMEILFPLSKKNDSKKDLNDISIVSRLVYKDNEFLFMGDAGIETEEVILLSNKNVSSDVLKVGHHGSFYSSSENFLQAVLPKVAVISVGENNKFGHPSNLVVKRLERRGVRIFRTDQDGDIVLISDGVKIYDKN